MAAAIAEAVAAAVDLACAELPDALPAAVLRRFGLIPALSCDVTAAVEGGQVGVVAEEPRAACRRPTNVNRPV